jgi:hypothetical protein
MEHFIDRREEWIESVKSAQRPSQLQAALDMLVTSVKKVWLRPWYAKSLEARMAYREAEREQFLTADNSDVGMSDNLDGDEAPVKAPVREPPVTVAMVAIALYSFDEGILLDPPKEADKSMGDLAQSQVCLYIYIHIHIYIYIYIYINTHTYEVKYAEYFFLGGVCVYVCIVCTVCIYIYIYIYTHTHTHTHTYVCMYIR